MVGEGDDADADADAETNPLPFRSPIPKASLISFPVLTSSFVVVMVLFPRTSRLAAALGVELGLGLGGKLFDQLIEEAMQRNVGAAYRAAMGRRSLSSALASQTLSTRIYLEVHAGASSRSGDDKGATDLSSHAVRLYKSRGFEERQRLQGFFRGDARIPAAVRSMPGGNDALLMERWVGR